MIDEPMECEGYVIKYILNMWKENDFGFPKGTKVSII